MSNGSRAKWDAAPVRVARPKPIYIDNGRKNAKRRKGGAPQRVGFCYVCSGSHLYEEPHL